MIIYEGNNSFTNLITHPLLDPEDTSDYRTDNIHTLGACIPLDKREINR